MSALASPEAQNEYAIAEQELHDNIVQIYGTRESEDDMFRPTLADLPKIGFFSLDRSCQTEITEVVDLKEMTEILQILLLDVATLRRDINFTKHAMQADHESKLQQKSLELYCRINERVSELEKIHLDRVGSLRKAFRQQLADAVARLAVVYTKRMETNMHRERTRQATDMRGQDAQMQQMKSIIAHNETVIQMLQQQLQQQQQMKLSERQLFLESTPTKSKSTPATESPILAAGDSPRSMSQINALQEEIEEMREEQERLEKKIEHLEETLEIKEDETTQLGKTIEELQHQLEREQILVEQLKHEKDELKRVAEKDILASKNQMEEMLMKQKLQLEQMNSEHIRLAKEEAMNQSRSEMARLQAEEHNKIKDLMEQKKELERQLVLERGKTADKNAKGLAEIDSLKQSEERLKAEVKKLREEIERIHQTWEKKFSILQASMHALKDESYLRQTLQRQAATLHHASVSYAADIPVGTATPKQGTPNRKLLPEIKKGQRLSANHLPQDRDYISFTVSAHSGRTAVTSVDENQVISDTEQDLPSDFPPIPEPPARTAQDCGTEESRPSTRSHIVVLPTAEV